MFTLEYQFSINDNRSIQITSNNFELITKGSILCKLKPRNNDNEEYMIKDSTRFVVECVGFDKEQDAYNFASKIVILIKYYGFRNSIGIYDFKNVTKINKAYFEKEFGRSVIDEDAIVVYETGKRPLMVSGSAKFRVSFNNDEINLKNDIDSFINLKLEDDPILNDIFKYYSDSKTSNTSEIRFLSIVLIVEKLMSTLSKEEKQVDQEKVKLIGELVGYLEHNEFSCVPEIKSGLGMMKKKSITKQIKILVEKYHITGEYFGLDAKIFLSECYQIRSNIVHANDTDILSNTKLLQYNLSSIISQLENLLVKMVDNYIEDKHKVIKQ